MLKRVIQAAVLIALTMGPAAAQIPLSFPTNAKASPTPEQAARQRALDNAYNSATKKIPDKKPVTDPWGDIRPTPKTAAKTRQ